MGKAILLPDKETGGLKVRTFINITLGRYKMISVFTTIMFGQPIKERLVPLSRVCQSIFTCIKLFEEQPLTEGEFLIDVKYNGKDLYDNHWEFCTIDENKEVRQVFCPYKPGFYAWATDKKIPKYIPKVLTHTDPNNLILKLLK